MKTEQPCSSEDGEELQTFVLDTSYS